MLHERHNWTGRFSIHFCSFYISFNYKFKKIYLQRFVAICLKFLFPVQTNWTYFYIPKKIIWNLINFSVLYSLSNLFSIHCFFYIFFLHHLVFYLVRVQLVASYYSFSFLSGFQWIRFELFTPPPLNFDYNFFSFNQKKGFSSYLKVSVSFNLFCTRAIQ